MVDEFLRDLTRSIVECEELEETKAIARRALGAGAGPLDIVGAISKALNIVGDLYERREYFLMELTLVGSTAAEIMEMIKPEFGQSIRPVLGRVVIGTVFGDLHYIGKDIVIAMLESRGFSVTDLGVDVPTERFLSAVKEIKPDILAMSGLLTIVVEEMKRVIDALKREGLRDSVRVMIGGRAVSQEYAKEMGADAFGANAVDAVRLAVEWVGGE